MDWITTTVFLSVLKAALCFNIDPVAWKYLTRPDAGFGYQVVQRRSDLLVSAPIAQYSPNGRGKIFRCTTTSCSELQVSGSQVNMSIGLTMTSDPASENTMVCGPTIPRDCHSITMYSGLCFQIDRFNAVSAPIPSSEKECQSADIAFLLDGSGSVARNDFNTMKMFVTELVRSLLPLDAKFAIAQFSTNPQVHYYFDDFLTGTTPWDTKIRNIRQKSGGTHTAEAIKYVVNNIFTSTKGARSNVRKVLVVITDGESQDYPNLPDAVNTAERKKIVRFAIGVGNAFKTARALNELNTIASVPNDKHMFQVESFDALEKIREGLQSKLFAIEGSQTTGTSLKMEMAQEGFSAAYVPKGILMGIVGANVWRGGYRQYSVRNGNMKANFEPPILIDSYLGYSMAVATTRRTTLIIVGAPRYDHRGVVMVVSQDGSHKMIDPFLWKFQSGEYFGAAVCAMDLDRDSYTDLILISAPMFMEADREGRVYVCSLTELSVECHFDSGGLDSVLRGDGIGRFGSSLAVLPDLNADGLNDLAVGAPLENNGQGSIYIFLGEGQGKISSNYSQRIAASEVQSGLKFFGMSISQSSFDHSRDSLPDLAVGSKGAVVLLRSKPVVMVEATVTYIPNKIPTQNVDCSKSLQNTARICFTMTRHSHVDQARAQINFTLMLDATRKAPNKRASTDVKQHQVEGKVTLDLRGSTCYSIVFSIEACPDDALNSLDNELTFSFEGLPSSQNLRPSLALQAQTTRFHPLGFQINCGVDLICIDNLKVDINFTNSLVVKVGIDELLDVTVSLENTQENAYNSRVILTYPPGLSYRKFTTLQGKIECNSLDSEDGLTRGRTDCSVDKPIMKSNTKTFFIVSYGIKAYGKLDRRIFVSANATSDNQKHSDSSELYKIKGIDVKYSIFATIDSTLSYNNFSFGNNNLQKPVQQSIVVTNDIRALNYTVVFRVPVALGDKDIWVDSSSFQIPGCQRDRDEDPNVTDFVAKIQENKLVDCSVARCSVFNCHKYMGRLESKYYNISANLSSGWLEQIGLSSAKFLLTSTASLEYDRDQYIFSNNKPPVRKIVAEVEVYAEQDFTSAIVGGSLGGLALLLILTAVLYKAGFFKSKYKDMINEDAAGAEGAQGAEGAAGGGPE